MERELLEDIVLHLAAVRRLYPGGVQECPAADECPVEPAGLSYCGPDRPELLLVAVLSAGGDREAGRALLSAAVSKGLQPGVDRVGVLEVCAGGVEPTEVQRSVAQRAPRIVAVLGETAWALLGAAGGTPAAHVLTDCGERRCLLTHAPAEMLADQGKKREFWNDLKAIMVELGWRA